MSSNFNGMNNINNNNPINNINTINRQTFIPNQDKNRLSQGVGQPQIYDNNRYSLGQEQQNTHMQSQFRFATNINTLHKQQLNTPPPNTQGKIIIQQPSTPIIQSNKKIIPNAPIKQDISQQQLMNKIQQMGIDCSDALNITEDERSSLENSLFQAVQQAQNRQEDRRVRFN